MRNMIQRLQVLSWPDDGAQEGDQRIIPHNVKIRPNLSTDYIILPHSRMETNVGFNPEVYRIYKNSIIFNVKHGFNLNAFIHFARVWNCPPLYG